MPIVLRVGPYRFHFWSNEGSEPPHVHVIREKCEAKFWLDPLVELAENRRFSAHELNRVRKLVEKHRALLLEAWNEFFSE